MKKLEEKGHRAPGAQSRQDFPLPRKRLARPGWGHPERLAGPVIQAPGDGWLAF